MTLSGIKFILAGPGSIRLFMLVILFSSLSMRGQHAHVKDHHKDADRAAWIEKAISSLKAEQMSDDENIIELQQYESMEAGLTDFRVRVSHNKLIVFRNGDRVRFACNSAHEDEDVGDICVAICNNGKIYIAEAHVCGGIVNFGYRGKLAPESSAFFFEKFLSDLGNIPWVNYSTP